MQNTEYIHKGIFEINFLMNTVCDSASKEYVTNIKRIPIIFDVISHVLTVTLANSQVF